jgi:DNA-directed RNA polymerase subunit RPC12/RpoP
MARWLNRHRWLGNLVAVALAAAFVICTPLWMPVGLALHGVYRRRLQKAAGTVGCLRCGRIVGVEALRLADKAWAEEMEDLKRRYPGARFRLERTLNATCPGCGTRYMYRESDRTFILEPPRGESAENASSPPVSA